MTSTIVLLLATFASTDGAAASQPSKRQEDLFALVTIARKKPLAARVVDPRSLVR